MCFANIQYCWTLWRQKLMMASTAETFAPPKTDLFGLDVVRNTSVYQRPLLPIQIVISLYGLLFGSSLCILFSKIKDILLIEFPSKRPGFLYLVSLERSSLCCHCERYWGHLLIMWPVPTFWGKSCQLCLPSAHFVVIYCISLFVPLVRGA